MLKTMAGLVPFAVVLAGIGVAIWWLLSREMALGRWVFGGFVVAHGLIHMLFVVPAPATTAGGAEWPFDLTQSWLVTSVGLDVGPVRVIGVALIGLVVVGFLLAGLATVGILVPSGWWPALVVASAAASAVLLVLFFNPQLVLGMAIDALLLWVVLDAVWTPTATVS
jgi:hypothetical protein